MVNRYRTKPCTIEAVKWTGENHREMFDFLTGSTDRIITTSGENFFIDHSVVEGGLVIKTLEGPMIASIGEYIIKGLRCEFYPCKRDVFEKKYELIK